MQRLNYTPATCSLISVSMAIDQSPEVGIPRRSWLTCSRSTSTWRKRSGCGNRIRVPAQRKAYGVAHELGIAHMPQNLLQSFRNHS
jgi:hypothetical protein